MTKQELFTINKWTYKYGTGDICEIISIYGPTREKLQSSRPVNSNVRYGYAVIDEEKKKLKTLNALKTRNKYFQSGRMEEWEQEKKQITMETNWKLRVLNEQERSERKKMEEERKKMEAANTLVEFAEQARKEVAQKERARKAKMMREDKTIQDQDVPIRRSKRLKAKQDKINSI